MIDKTQSSLLLTYPKGFNNNIFSNTSSSKYFPKIKTVNFINGFILIYSIKTSPSKLKAK